MKLKQILSETRDNWLVRRATSILPTGTRLKPSNPEANEYYDGHKIDVIKQSEIGNYQDKYKSLPYYVFK